MCATFLWLRGVSHKRSESLYKVRLASAVTPPFLSRNAHRPTSLTSSYTALVTRDSCVGEFLLSRHWVFLNKTDCIPIKVFIGKTGVCVCVWERGNVFVPFQLINGQS